MKFHPDDPRLTAYLLGELTPDEAAAVERAAAADPAVQLALRDTERVQLLLARTLAPASASLLPRQRENVRRSARQAATDGKLVTLASHRRSWKTWLVPLSAAAAIALAVIALTRLPAGSAGPPPPSTPPPATAEDWSQIPLEVALLPAPGPADASRLEANPNTIRPAASAALAERTAARTAALERAGDEFLRKVAERLEESPVPQAADLPQLVPRNSVAAADFPTLELPVHAGRASLDWISHSIRQERRLPPANAVRLEEILNAFPLRPSGSTAIASGVTLSTEILPCPWKPSAALLLVSIRGASDSARVVEPVFHPNLETVRRYRLLGFATLKDVQASPLPTRLPSSAIITIALEIEPHGSATDFGAIEWSVDGEPAAAVALTRQPEFEPSDDARFAAMLCALAQWLSGEQSGTIDGDMVAALAREVDSPTLPADRLDLLALIHQALAL